MNAQDTETGHKITDEELYSHIRVFLVSGFEVTAHSLTWFLYHLCIHPQYQKKLHKEVDSILGSNKFPTTEHLNKLRLLTYCINESMRMLPVAAIAAVREIDQDLELCGFKIPKGTEVWSPTYCIHYNLKYWDKPTHFL